MPKKKVVKKKTTKKAPRKKATKKASSKRKPPSIQDIIQSSTARNVRGAKPGDHDPKTGAFAKGNTAGNRFQKGQSGNPLGRGTQTRHLTNLMKYWLEEPATRVPMFKEMAEKHGLNPKTTTIQDVLMLNHLGQVGIGEGAFMKEMFNRVEGKVVDRVVAQIGDKMGVSEFMEALGTHAERSGTPPLQKKKKKKKK